MQTTTCRRPSARPSCYAAGLLAVSFLAGAALDSLVSRPKLPAGLLLGLIVRCVPPPAVASYPAHRSAAPCPRHILFFFLKNPPPPEFPPFPPPNPLPI